MCQEILLMTYCEDYRNVFIFLGKRKRDEPIILCRFSVRRKSKSIHKTMCTKKKKVEEEE